MVLQLIALKNMHTFVFWLEPSSDRFTDCLAPAANNDGDCFGSHG